MFNTEPKIGVQRLNETTCSVSRSSYNCSSISRDTLIIHKLGHSHDAALQLEANNWRCIYIHICVCIYIRGYVAAAGLPL